MGYIGVGSITEDEAVKDHTKSCCYLVQEFMDGGTLKQKVWRQVSHCSRKYFPLISTIFFFCSQIWMVPASFTATSHLVVIFGLSLVLLITSAQFCKHR